MRSIDIIDACTALGVSVDGAALGPEILTEDLINKKVDNIHIIHADEDGKEKEKDNKKKNLKKLNEFNIELYNRVLKSIDEKSYLEAKSQEIQLHIDNTNNLNNQSYFSGAIDEASSLLHLTPSQIASKGYKIYTYFDKIIKKYYYEDIDKIV